MIFTIIISSLAVLISLLSYITFRVDAQKKLTIYKAELDKEVGSRLKLEDEYNKKIRSLKEEHAQNDSALDEIRALNQKFDKMESFIHNSEKNIHEILLELSRTKEVYESNYGDILNSLDSLLHDYKIEMEKAKSTMISTSKDEVDGDDYDDDEDYDDDQDDSYGDSDDLYDDPDYEDEYSEQTIAHDYSEGPRPVYEEQSEGLAQDHSEGPRPADDDEIFSESESSYAPEYLDDEDITDQIDNSNLQYGPDEGVPIAARIDEKKPDSDDLSRVPGKPKTSETVYRPRTMAGNSYENSFAGTKPMSYVRDSSLGIAPLPSILDKKPASHTGKSSWGQEVSIPLENSNLPNDFDPLDATPQYDEIVDDGWLNEPSAKNGDDFDVKKNLANLKDKINDSNS